MPMVVLDIDGTLSDNSARLHFLAGPVMDYLSFFGAARYDPAFGGATDYVAMLGREFEIAYFTSRADHYRESTLRWLDNNGFPRGPLVMRAGPDFRDAAIVKLELLRHIGPPASIAMVVEDDPRVMSALSDAGYAVCPPPWIRAR